MASRPKKYPLRDGFKLTVYPDTDGAKYAVTHPDIAEGKDSGFGHILVHYPSKNTTHIDHFYNYFDPGFAPSRGIMRDALHKAVICEHKRRPLAKWKLYASGHFPRDHSEKDLRALVDSYNRRFGFQVSQPDELEKSLYYGGVDMHADGEDLLARSHAFFSPQPPVEAVSAAAPLAGQKRGRHDGDLEGSGVFRCLDPFSVQALMASGRFTTMH